MKECLRPLLWETHAINSFLEAFGYWAFGILHISKRIQLGSLWTILRVSPRKVPRDQGCSVHRPKGRDTVGTSKQSCRSQGVLELRCALDMKLSTRNIPDGG